MPGKVLGTMDLHGLRTTVANDGVKSLGPNGRRMEPTTLESLKYVLARVNEARGSDWIKERPEFGRR